MENYNKLKKYNTYIKEANDKPGEDISKEQIDARIKEIVTGVLKTKQYFEMLQDTAEHVYELLAKNIPPNTDSFLSTLYEKDELLADLMDTITSVADESYCLSEISEVIEALNNIEKYTEGNIDNILSGEEMTFEEEEDDDDDYEEDDDEEIEKDEIVVKPEEDQLKRKSKPIEESLKRKGELNKKTKEIEDFIKRFKKPVKKEEDEEEDTIGKFKKGETVYLGGITGHMSHKFNGLKCEIMSISEIEDDEICYDLYSPSIKAVAENGSNIKGMPERYIHREKQEAVEEPRRKAIIKKKG